VLTQTGECSGRTDRRIATSSLPSDDVLPVATPIARIYQVCVPPPSFYTCFCTCFSGGELIRRLVFRLRVCNVRAPSHRDITLLLDSGFVLDARLYYCFYSLLITAARPRWIIQLVPTSVKSPTLPTLGLPLIARGTFLTRRLRTILLFRIQAGYAAAITTVSQSGNCGSSGVVQLRTID